MAQYAGYSGDVTVGGTALQVGSWSASASANLNEVTNKADAGFRRRLKGLRELSISMEMVFDDSIHNVGSPLLLQEGGTLTTLKLNYDSGGTLYVDVPEAIIETLDIDNSVDGVITYSVSAFSQGGYTLATNS